MNIIDIHANVGWDVNNTRKNLHPNGQSYAALLHKMENNGVEKAVIVPFPSPGAQFSENAFWYDIENQHLMEAAQYAKNLIPFPAVNPKDPQSVKNIQTLTTAFGIRGVKFSHQVPMDFGIDKLLNHPLMRIIQKNNLMLMIHIGTGKEPGSQNAHTTLDFAVKVAKKYPDCKFIFCHLGRLHETIMEALNLDNVQLDTAALSMQVKWSQFLALEPLHIFEKASPPQVIEKLVDLGYEDKILFGSDEPYTSYASEIECIEKAVIADSAKRKLFYDNSKKLLGLK